MRSLLLTLICMFTLALSAQKQEAANRAPRVREIGLRLSGLEDFDFIYKKSLAENTYRRYRFFTGSLDLGNLDGNSLGVLNLGAAIGKERRVRIADKLDFIRGPEYSASVLLTATDDDFQAQLSARFGYVLGFTYLASDRFYLGIETIPGVSVTYGNGIAQVIQLSAGFNSNAIALTAVYRFMK